METVNFIKLRNRLYRNFSDTQRMGYGKVNLGATNPCEVTVLWNLEKNIKDIGIVLENTGSEALFIPEIINQINESNSRQQTAGEIRTAGQDFDSNEIVFSKVVYLYTSFLSIDAAILKDHFHKHGYRLKIRTYGNLSDEKRYALVLGNSEYEHLPTLKNPGNDVKAIGKKLSELGFTVKSILNFTKAEIESIVDELSSEVKDFNEVVVYYAGHGYYMRGVHYIIPTDAKIDYQIDLEYSGVRLDRLLEINKDHIETPIQIVIFDACRLPAQSDYSESANEDFKQENTFMAYATSIGVSASDGRSLGVFTESLLQHISTPEITINELFELVNKDVSLKTKKAQIPWYQSSLVNDYRLNELLKFS